VVGALSRTAGGGGRLQRSRAGKVGEARCLVVPRRLAVIVQDPREPLVKLASPLGIQAGGGGLDDQRVARAHPSRVLGRQARSHELVRSRAQ
jgi:hypothetical protein